MDAIGMNLSHIPLVKATTNSSFAFLRQLDLRNPDFFAAGDEAAPTNDFSFQRVSDSAREGTLVLTRLGAAPV